MATQLNGTNAWGTTLLRLTVGGIFAAHGAQKLFQMTPAGVAGFFGQIGIPFPELNAYFVIALELIGGIAMITGLGTRILGALFTVVMAVSIVTVHGPNGFFLPNGYEFVLLVLVASATLVIQGAGAFALDNLIAERKPEVPELSPARA